MPQNTASPALQRAHKASVNSGIFVRSPQTGEPRSPLDDANFSQQHPADLGKEGHVPRRPGMLFASQLCQQEVLFNLSKAPALPMKARRHQTPGCTGLGDGDTHTKAPEAKNPSLRSFRHRESKARNKSREDNAGGGGCHASALRRARQQGGMERAGGALTLAISKHTYIPLYYPGGPEGPGERFVDIKPPWRQAAGLRKRSIHAAHPRKSTQGRQKPASERSTSRAHSPAPSPGPPTSVHGAQPRGQVPAAKRARESLPWYSCPGT